MRELHGHKVNPANDKLVIQVHDEPGSGGAHHHYSISGFDTDKNPANLVDGAYRSSFSRTPIIFQNGPIGEAGVNGLTHEALLAILIDRMSSFQAGPYACAENGEALAALEAAQAALHSRTLARMARNVEGTHAA